MINQRMKGLGQERSAIRELFEFGLKRAQAIGKENVYDFSLGNPNAPTPQAVTDELLRLIKETPAEVLHGYTSASGDPAVRAAISEYYEAEYAFALPANFIYMTCGAAASLTCTLNGICNAGDEVVVVAPYFPEYKVFIEGTGATLVSVTADERFHLDLKAIEGAITPKTKGVLINTPNNPTGAVYGEEELSALSTLLRNKSKEYGAPVYLISDEPYRELSYAGKTPCILNLYENTIVCYSFSKSLSLAGERIGYVAVHPEAEGASEVYAAVCGAGRSQGYVCAPALFQRVVKGQLGKTADLSVYLENRDLLYSKLTEYGFTCIPPEGAFYLFVKSPLKDAKAFCERAKAYELLLVPSDSFGIEGYVRISYCVDGEMIKRSLPAFEKLAKEFF